MSGGPWRPRMAISGAAQGPGSASPSEPMPQGMAHHGQQQQQGMITGGGNDGGSTQFACGSSSSCSNCNVAIVNNLNRSSGYGGYPAPTAFSGVPPGAMRARPLPSPAANSPTGGVLTGPIQTRQVSSGVGGTSRGENTEGRRIDRDSRLDTAGFGGGGGGGAEGSGGGVGNANGDGDRGPENGERRRLSCDYCAKKKTKCSGGVGKCLR